MKKSTSATKKSKYSKRAKRLQKEVLLSFIIFIFAIFLIVKYHSSPTSYKVVIFQEDNQVELVQYYSNFKVAQKEMMKQIEQGAYNPAVLKEDDTILSIRYGIVNFRTKTCGENTNYTLVSTKANSYTNGCYGADGAYLQTSDDASKVLFKQSGATGWVDMQDIEIRNVQDPAMVASINHYTIKENQILHMGTTDLNQNAYEIAIPIGENTLELSERDVYSYDGHYFYETYPKMIDDYRNNTYANSLNAETPYYNYYQYIGHRTKSAYVTVDINYYITNYLGFQAKPSGFPPLNYESQLYDEGYSFVDAQNNYGSNAIMMFSLAVNESGLGKSQISIEKNNLFGHAAYDNAPAENAEGYQSVADSISTHADIFLNSGYLNPCDQSEEGSEPSVNTCLNRAGNRYAGGFFGDKGSGLNVSYASDPYWGEKAANYYRNFDEVMGGKDKDRYVLKVAQAKNKNVYAYPTEKSNVLYITPNYENYAVVVLDEIEGTEVEGSTLWYKIQSDAALNSKRDAVLIHPEKYSFSNDIAYVPAAYFK